MDKLAVNGGVPYITDELPTKLLGISLLGEEEKRELCEVIDRRAPFRHYGIGIPDKVAKFEEMASTRFEGAYTLAVSSGSAALTCAAVAVGLEPGDEVIIPTLSWYSDYACVTNVGATPVFAGIDDTMNLDPADFEKRITKRTKAVIAVHYQGAAPKLDEIVSIAQKHGIVVIEDMAQAFGGLYKGRPLGVIGDIGVASLQANKMITSGEGGLVVTKNKRYYETAVRYHDLGFVRPVFAARIADEAMCREDRSFAAQQYRMSEFAGAVMCAQFRKLDGMLEKCGGYHAKICAALAGSKRFSFRPTGYGDCGITLFLQFKTREEAKSFYDAAAAEGVPMGPSSGCVNMLTVEQVINKRAALDKLPPFAAGCPGESVVYDDKELRGATDDILERYVAVGIGPLYSEKNVDDIIGALKKVDALL